MAKSGFLNGLDGIVTVDTTGGGENVGTGGYGTTSGGSSQRPATLDINVTGGFLQATGSLSANKFSDIQHGGGRIFFPSASVEAAIDRTEYPSSRYRIPPKQSRRFVILNERQIALQRPLEVYDFEGDRFVYPELDSSLLQFSMSFENSVVTPATSSFFLGSYADITFSNLRTYSGDIHRMRVYAKYQNDQSDQETRIGDFIVRDKNELIDRSSVSGQAPIGVFYSQSVVDNNWVSSSNTSGPIQKNDSEIMSAVLLSGSNYNDGEFFDFKTSQYVPLVKAQDYIVNFASYFIKKPKQQPDGSVVDRAQIEVLLSGSVESTNQDLLSLGTISGLGDDSSETLEGKISGSIPNLFNYFTTHASIGAEPSASLVFRVHAGQFHIGRVQLRPLTFSNFHPDSYRVKLPMPKKAPRNQQYDFRVEFYDFNNNKSQFTTESTASIFFTGTNDVIDGLDNHLEGSMLWGNAMEIYGVSGNSAYMRSVGYQGFEKTRAGTGERNGGFMIFSGSIGTRITASEAYEGVGIEIVDASAGSGNPGQHKYLQFLSNYQNTGNARFRVQTDEFYFGQDRTQPNAQFISGSEGKIEISSSNFHLDNDGSIIMQGTITAEAGGTIGGFTIGSDNLTATDFVLNTTNKSLSLGSGNTIFIADADDGIQLGHATFASAPFSVTPAGVLKAESGTIGGFTLSSNELTATNFELNPSGKRITLGTGNSIFIADGDEGIQLGNSTFASAPFSVTTAGVVKAESGTIGGWTLSSTTLANGTDIVLDSSNKKITLDNGSLVIDNNSGTPVIRSATNFASGDGFFLSTATSNNFRVGDAGGARLQFTGTNTEIYNSSNSKLVSLGASNTIAGWTIDSDKISSNNLILHSDGFIETTNYASDVKGFFLGTNVLSDGSVGSFLEVDEARIRGTLKTTVFEKETVNAVGGQLQVGNATTITGSVAVGASDTVIQVANASGFASGEIILAKKFNSTGFTTEYMEVQSVAREDAASDTNFSGSLTVLRARGTSPASGTVSGSLGGTGATGQTYSPGQVLVSTGKIGTGYIRLNANPNDQATPFMDIVERTGSGVYDIDLKTRLGDLSGLSSGLVGTNPGFGLFTEKLFLRADNADSASIAVGSATDATTGTGLYMDGSGVFRVGNPSGNQVYWNGSTLAITGDITVSNTEDFVQPNETGSFTQNSATSSLENPSNYSFGGDATFPLNALPGSITTAGLYLGSNNLGYHDGSVYKTYMDSSGNFYLGGTSGALQWNGSSLIITGNISFTNSPNISTFTNDTGYTDDTVANSKPSVFRQTSQPSTSSPVGSLWYDTDDDNKLYVLVSGTPNVWTATQDGDIATAQSTADSRPKIFRQTSAPSTSEPASSLWYDTDDDNKLYVLVSSTWTATQDGDIATAQSAADAAQADATTALTRPKVFRQTSAPSTSEPGGSLWYDTDDDNKLYILVSSTWTATRDGQITTALADAAAAQSTATTVSDDLQDVIDGVSVSGAGTFIDANVIYSPLIAGTNGYISNVFKVGNAGITLDGVNKKIYIGTGTYNNSNTAFYVDNTNNFSLGNKLSWNGSALNITGDLTATNLTATTAGNIGGWTINSTNIEKDGVRLNAGSNNGYLGIGITSYNTNNGIWIGETSSGLYQMSLKNSGGTKYFKWDGTNLEVDAGNFSLDSSGNITATSVDLTGEINATTGNFTSTVTIGDGATTGTLAVGTDTNKINIIGTNSDSTTKIAASNGAFEMKGDGTATFANGNITFESDGDITSQDFLIERTRLFGAGEDGSKTLTDGVGTITSDDDGGTMFTESSGVFTQQRDIYCDNLTLDNSAGNVTLKTNGYRIFVKDTLTIESGCVIHNDGTAGNNGQSGTGNNTTSGIIGGDGGSGGAGAPSGTLKGGPTGASGGAGGSVDSTGTAEHKASGGGGGGAGGSGGIVLIVARNISNSGTIRCNGGAGGSGGNGGTSSP